MADLIDTYKRSWHRDLAAWTKRGDAADFALFLAGELGITPKAVTVDKDGKTYRVYVPLLSVYWDPPEQVDLPVGSIPQTWNDCLETLKRRMKTWASE